MLKNRQILKRKLIISKKNDFFKSFGQILFNRSFVDKDFSTGNPFFINKYVAKYSSNFFDKAFLKMKFPLEGKIFSYSDIGNLNLIKLSKKVIVILNSMFIYITALNFFCVYNFHLIFILLIETFLSFVYFFLYTIFFLSN